jgi:hypothetical protein
MQRADGVAGKHGSGPPRGSNGALVVCYQHKAFPPFPLAPVSFHTSLRGTLLWRGGVKEAFPVMQRFVLAKRKNFIIKKNTII